MDFIKEEGRIYANDEAGSVIAEITFPAVSDSDICINKTVVDNNLRGQEIAGKLVEEVIDYAKANNKKIKATCSYAVTWFEKHPEYADYLA